MSNDFDKPETEATSEGASVMESYEQGPDVTPAQRAVLKKFRSNVKDILKVDHDDYYLVKWLRARNWDPTGAERMLRDDQEWRKRHDVDNVLTSYQPLEVFVNYYPGGYHGVTKQGYPIWIEPLARGDQRGFYNCVSRNEMMLYKIWQMETFFKVVCPTLSRKFGRKIDRCVRLVDVEGFGLKHLWKPAIDTLSALAVMAEEHYPDTFQSIIAINAPSILPLAYSLFKPFLSENTRSKITVLGRNYTEQLLKDIDPDQLPVHWGGTATDPDGDPYCRSKVCLGGLIPDKYYRKNLLMENNDLSRFAIATIGPGSSLKVDFAISVSNSLLSWNFWTDDHDIGFGVFRRTAADQPQKTNEMEVVVPTGRVPSHVIPESGRIKCEIPGTYVVRFDNNYSWMRAKKLYHLVEVVVPDPELLRPRSADI